MDKKLEWSNAGKVLRRFAKRIKDYGYIRTKPTFFVREAGPVVEFIHVHKFTFGPYFRMHICLRILNESQDFIALAGPTERELLQEAKFEYSGEIETVEACANLMSDFVANHVESWYLKWTDRSLLLAEDSPLYDDQKEALLAAINGKTDSENEQLSRSLLKIE